MTETDVTVPEEEDEATTTSRTQQHQRKGPSDRLPFRLWFSLTSDPGRSDLSLSHPLGLEPGVTGKFYTLRETRCKGTPDVDAVKKIYDSGPKQKFPGHNPPLESHRYGWYSDVTFIDEEILRDRRINYHRRSSAMFKTPSVTKNSSNK